MDEPAALEQRLAPYSGAVPSPRHRGDAGEQLHDNPAEHPVWCAVRHESSTRHVGPEKAWRPHGNQHCRLSIRLVSSAVIPNAAPLVKLGILDENIDGQPRVADVDLTAADVRELVRWLEAAVRTGS